MNGVDVLYPNLAAFTFLFLTSSYFFNCYILLTFFILLSQLYLKLLSPKDNSMMGKSVI